MPNLARKLDADTASVAYDVASTPLGYVLVAATARGVSFIQIGPDKADLIERFRQKPTAKKLAAEQTSLPYTKLVAAFISGTSRELEFPIDADGTDFQQKVWKAMRKVPYGTTITYTELAQKAGLTAAVRAVANACGANPLALYYPCHRIVRTDGGLGGYSGGGVEVKKKLLAMEAK